MKRMIIMVCGLIVSGSDLHAMEQGASNALVEYQFEKAQGFKHLGTDFVAGSPDGNSIMSVSSLDKSVIVRKNGDKRVSFMTYNYPYQVKYGVFSGDSSMAAVGLSGRTEQDYGFIILNMNDEAHSSVTSNTSNTSKRHLPNVYCLSLAFTPDDKKVIAADTASVHMVKHDTGQVLFSANYKNNPIAKCVISEALLYILMRDGSVKTKFLDDFKDSSELTYTPPRSSPESWGVSVASSKNKIAIVHQNVKNITVRKIETGEKIVRKSDIAQKVEIVAISPDSTMIACDAIPNTGATCLYIANIDPSSNSEPRKVPFGEKSFESIAFSHDSQYVLVVSNDGTSAIFEAKTGNKVFDFETKYASYGCFDSNGNAFVAGRDERGSVAVAERFEPKIKLLYDDGDDCCVS